MNAPLARQGRVHNQQTSSIIDAAEHQDYAVAQCYTGNRCTRESHRRRSGEEPEELAFRDGAGVVRLLCALASQGLGMISCRPVGVSPQLTCSASSSPASPFFSRTSCCSSSGACPAGSGPFHDQALHRQPDHVPLCSHCLASAGPPARSKIASPTWLREPKVKLSEPICHGRCFL